MHAVWRNLRGALVRVFPDAQTYAQATAFNSFLALFPVLLVLLGVLTATPRLNFAVEEMVTRLQTILPPGSRTAVMEHLTHFGGDPMKWIVLGLTGTIFAGSGAMASLMQGFRVIHQDDCPTRFWREQGRAFSLLSMTLLPWVVSVVLTVFGQQVRTWMIARFGLPQFFNVLWTVVYTTLALVLAMITLAFIYHFGRTKRTEWTYIWPGTVVATLLWWTVNTIFGYYVSRVPYSIVYGGLAAAIGLLVWMYLSALVVYIGAGYNAEANARAPEPIFPDGSILPAPGSEGAQ